MGPKQMHGREKRPIQKLVARWLRLCAWRMGRQWQKMGRKSQLLAFGMFLGCSAAGCILLILTGGFISGNTLRPDPITTIAVPPGKDAEGQGYQELLQGIRAFESYMDSLCASDSGTRTRDSILRARPGLLDSIRVVKLLYNNQN